MVHIQSINTVIRRRSAGLTLLATAFWLTSGSGSPSMAGPTGYASLNGGVTGGAGGPVVTVTTASQFQQAVSASGPRTIRVPTSLNIGQVQVKSDKTIIGVDGAGELIGSLQLSSVSNVVIRNLAISNPDGVGVGDAITLWGSTNVWIDHNEISDAPDGLLDIVTESDFVTVSWNKFFYTDEFSATHDHRFAMLIGNGDDRPQDADNLRITAHSNHWGENVTERMPRVRYGDVHVFDTYFNSPGNHYVVRSAIEAEVLVENSYFESVNTPFQKWQTGQIEQSGNAFVNTDDRFSGDDVFSPPYEYPLRNAEDVKDIVLARAGATLRLPGDYNDDGVVDARDYAVWRESVNQLPGVLPNDYDGGVIGAGQFETWLANFGAAQAALALHATAMPESGTLGMLLMAIAGGHRRRRPRAQIQSSLVAKYGSQN